jgi:hypothetical protein
VLAAATQNNREETKHVSNDMRQRCDDVVMQGEDPNYKDTLDYYTTQRVKHAYLRLNADGLINRMKEVREQQKKVLSVLLQADKHLHTQWTIPASDEEGGPVDTPVDDDTGDPNRLCIPQTSDYVIVTPTANDGVDLALE